MRNKNKYLFVFIFSLIAGGGVFLLSLCGNKIVTTFSESRPILERKTIIIDAGHGGVDGGATSCTGVLESDMNLDIALKLNDLCHLLGIKTIMIRTTDHSVHTQEGSIAAKKVSDLKERVRVVNETEDGILISIHQNYFSDSKYYGAQTFYADTEGSRDLACQLQLNISNYLIPENKRTAKRASGIYLMDHINTCGVLIECGFVSNPEENAKLLTEAYQKNLCCVIAGTISMYIKSSEVS